MSDGDEYNPRKLTPFDPRSLKGKDRTDKDIASAIERLPDKEARYKLHRFLGSLDVSKVKQGDFETIAKGAQGLMELALYIGPMGSRYRETLKIVGAFWSTFIKTHKDYLELQYPDQIRKEFEKFKREIIEAFEPYVEPEIFREIKSRFGL
ncbi:MAG: hypothetical protein ABIH23_05890 [bacterium]